jgi:hypothetical protein
LIWLFILLLFWKTEKCGNMIDIFTWLSWWTIVFPYTVLNWKFNIDLGCMIILSIKKQVVWFFLQWSFTKNSFWIKSSIDMKIKHKFILIDILDKWSICMLLSNYLRNVIRSKILFFLSLMRKRKYSFRLIQIRFVTSKASDFFLTSIHACTCRCSFAYFNN